MSVWHRAMRVFVYPRVFVLLPYPGMIWVPHAQQYRPQNPNTTWAEAFPGKRFAISGLGTLPVHSQSADPGGSPLSPLKAGLGSSVWTHLGTNIDTVPHRVWPGSKTRHFFLRDPKLGNSWASVPQFKTRDTVNALLAPSVTCRDNKGDEVR